MTKSAFCKKCGVPIRWVVSEKGVHFPIEPSSDPAGTFVLEARPGQAGSSRQVAVGLSRHEREMERAKGTLLFRHHQSVCYPRSRTGKPPPPAVKARANQIIAQAKGDV